MSEKEKKSPRVGVDVMLRDYFAGQAMHGMLSACSDSEIEEYPDETDIADWAYEYADAMLKARDK